jgi:hypothetical protein
MTDTERLHQAADRLHEWLRNWPNKSSGKCSTIRIQNLDGMDCILMLTPTEVVEEKRQKRINRWFQRRAKKS